MNKVINNILILIIWMLYFFIACVNVISDKYINGVIILILSVCICTITFIKLKELKSSKTVFLSMLLLIAYYFTMNFFSIPNSRFYGIFPIIALFSGVILTRVICNNKENTYRLIFAITNIITLIGLLSIDMASLQLFATYLNILIKAVTGVDYLVLNIFEQGTRMMSIITNPNIFASLTAISIFLNLYLYDEEYKKQSVMYMLFINMTAFIYSFSLGAILAFIVCLVIYLIVNRKYEINKKLHIIIVTGILAFISAAIGFRGMGEKGVIACLPLVSLFICSIFLKDFINKRYDFFDKIWSKFAKYRYECIEILIILLCLGALLTKPIVFTQQSNERDISVNLEQGNYKAKLFFDREIDANIEIYGQTYEQASKRAFELICSEKIRGDDIVVSFSTPIDNKAVKFKIKSNKDVTLKKINIYDSNNKFIKKANMDYLLIPDFIENRLASFSVNQNSIQRFTFFFDGIKIWRQSPIIGKGPSAFENNYKKIQTTSYSTWSSHNFLIDTLCDVGIVGIVCIVLFIVYLMYLVIKNFDNKFIKILGIILIYMIGHSMVEMNFIYIPYIFTFGAISGFVSLQSGESFKNKKMPLINTILLLTINIINLCYLTNYIIG